MLQRVLRLPVHKVLRSQLAASQLRATAATTNAVHGLVQQRNARGFATVQKPASAKDVTTKLMQIVSSESHIQEYVQVYGTPGVTRTTVIKIGGEVIENELDTLVNSLIFLKEAGLFPILVHGAGPQMNAELEKAGIDPQYVKGNRVTDKDTLAIAKKIFLKANRKIVDALVAAGAPARPITTGVFEAKLKDLPVYGYVGEVSQIYSEGVESAIANGQIPVLSCLGESADGQTLNINADVAARELALNIQPYKTIFINAKGGWIEDDGTKLKGIDMSKDYERMAARDYTGRQGTLLKLNEINALLQGLPSSSSVALTSASALSREILSSCSTGTVCIRGDKPQASAAGGIAPAAPKRRRVGLIGARGYAGREIIRLVGQHPELELVCASSRALVGKKVIELANAPPLNPHTNLPAAPIGNTKQRLNISDELEFCDLGLDQISTSPFADSVDVWILALPNGHCEKYASVLDGLKRKDKMIIDLSADQRFNAEWTYGLPEAPGGRAKVLGATHIANPGCYATGAQLGLLPLLGGKPEISASLLDTSIPPHVFGVSGYSGAGTGLSNANNPAVLADNIMAYKSVNHIHEREVSHHLGTPVRFMPHVAPFFQGIHLTLSVQLKDASLTEKHIEELYQEFYAKEALVNVTGSMPLVKDIAGTHGVTLGGFQIDKESGRMVVISTIDNLLKGAATQAVQNINVALGLDEYAGIQRS
uniref:acetylglutamate kinase n=1 Tax=Globisporangium ultimum (strain ATCC 200006 / CBS 805.95 / DAOM BR144) TaxID=431595 RepID=K3W6N9_GLOUD